MKLERLLIHGNEKKEYEIPIEDDQIKTLSGFIEMQENDLKIEDKARSYISSVSKSIAQAATNAAEEKGINSIGISGGVSYNRPIVETIRDYLNKEGYKLIVHNKVPNGDMGVPVGQAYIASHNLS